MEKERNKPDYPLIGQDGNVFNLIGIASRTLKENGMASEAKEMSSRVFDSGSCGEALSIIGEYVNPFPVLYIVRHIKNLKKFKNKKSLF